MKKHTILLYSLFLFLPSCLLAQPFEDIATSIPGMGRSYVAWGDYDKDGDLDVAVCGELGSGMYGSYLYRNDEGTFIDISAEMKGVKDGSLEWGDFDNDNDLDILLTGETYDEGNISLIYRNDNGTFAEYDAGFSGVGYGHGAWGDFDNDGDLDVLITGNWKVELYENINGTFSLVEEDFGQLQNSRAAWGDFDNDGDLDLLLAGDTGGGYFSGVFLNNGGSFEFVDLGMLGLFSGTTDWVDYDNDGDMDISITGFDIFLEPLFLIYTNNGDGTIDSLSHTMEGVSTSGLDWGDYDNDGDLDVLMSGKTGCCGGSATKIYRNDPDGFNEEMDAGISGAIRAGTAWADFDNDGDLDFLLTGMTPGETPYTKLILNAAGENEYVANSLPIPPSNLISSVDGSSVNLSWDKATDLETPQDGLNYNYRIGTMPGGNDVVVPMAHAETGFRSVQAIGNTNAEITRMVAGLTPGTYYWSVQSIDQAYCGSPFAEEQSFTILATEIGELSKVSDIRIYPNPAGELVFLKSNSPSIVDYKIFNVSGQQLLEGSVSSGQAIDISSLNAGVYIVRIIDVAGVSVQQLLKQ